MVSQYWIVAKSKISQIIGLPWVCELQGKGSGHALCEIPANDKPVASDVQQIKF